MSLQQLPPNLPNACWEGATLFGRDISEECSEIRITRGVRNAIVAWATGPGFR